MKLSLGKKAALVVFLVLFIDQVFKLWIKLHMDPNQPPIPILGNWFFIHFTENPGMAFGMKFGGSFGKLLLSTFRIAAVFGIGWYLVRLVKTNAHTGLIVSIALIMAGAIGNIIDSAFYGLIFDKGPIYYPATDSWGSYSGIAHLGHKGYAGFLQGSVVDMLHFPIIDTTLPSWVPIWGSKPFQFFSPIFNIADSSITIGVAIILFFQKRFFKHEKEQAN